MHLPCWGTKCGGEAKRVKDNSWEEKGHSYRMRGGSVAGGGGRWWGSAGVWTVAWPYRRGLLCSRSFILVASAPTSVSSSVKWAWWYHLDGFFWKLNEKVCKGPAVGTASTHNESSYPPPHPQNTLQPVSHSLSEEPSWGVGVLPSLLWECRNSQGGPIHPLACWVILVLSVCPIGGDWDNREIVAPGLRFSRMSETQNSQA